LYDSRRSKPSLSQVAAAYEKLLAATALKNV